MRLRRYAAWRWTFLSWFSRFRVLRAASSSKVYADQAGLTDEQSLFGLCATDEDVWLEEGGM